MLDSWVGFLQIGQTHLYISLPILNVPNPFWMQTYKLKALHESVLHFANSVKPGVTAL